MKRFIFGITLTVIGLVYSTPCFLWAVVKPWTWNGIGGLLGSFLGTDTLIPFILATMLMVLGLLISGMEAFHKK